MSGSRPGADAPASWQESDVLAMPRVGGLASMPSRLETLAKVIPAILPQLDRLYVFLDGHAIAPESVRHDKITVLRVKPDGDVHSSGKFLGLTREKAACVYAAFDDDIIYPGDYVETLARALGRFGGRVIAGFHGTLFTPPFRSFLRNQDVCHFGAGLAQDIRVDTLGTGTSAFISSVLPLDPRSWAYPDIDDLMVALAAESREVPRVAIARPARYLEAYAEGQPDSLWARAERDDRRQTRLMRQLLAMEQKSRLGLPPRR